MQLARKLGVQSLDQGGRARGGTASTTASTSSEAPRPALTRKPAPFRVTAVIGVSARTWPSSDVASAATSEPSPARSVTKSPAAPPSDTDSSRMLAACPGASGVRLAPSSHTHTRRAAWGTRAAPSSSSMHREVG